MHQKATWGVEQAPVLDHGARTATPWPDLRPQPEDPRFPMTETTPAPADPPSDPHGAPDIHDPAADGVRAKYKRVMLKISGEALMGDQGYGLHPPTVERIAREVKSVHDLGVEISMVIGGGNIFRGLQGSAQGMERTTADYMGMLATVMNALAMQSALEGMGVYTRVISAIPMDQVCEPYIRRRAVRHLEKNRVVIFAAGTGNPYFTTDTAATLRANEMKCEAIFKGTKVDGVYDKDPKKHEDAKRFETVSYDEVLAQHLGVMDASAIALARENDVPIIVFSLDEPGGFRGILAGQGTYTTVK
jgi:uridylate kinase